MTKGEFIKLAEEHLFILEGSKVGKRGNKEMKIYGFDALFEQLTISRVVGQSEQLFCGYCGSEKQLKVETDLNSGRVCKSQLCAK